MRATSLGSMVVWPGDKGTIDEKSCKGNVKVIKHVTPAYKTWNDVILVPTLEWILSACGQCWEARG